MIHLYFFQYIFQNVTLMLPFFTILLPQCLPFFEDVTPMLPFLPFLYFSFFRKYRSDINSFIEGYTTEKNSEIPEKVILSPLRGLYFL